MSNDFTDHEKRVEEIIAKLEAELFNDGEGADEHERGFRAGWNSRARSIVEQLRGGK